MKRILFIGCSFLATVSLRAQEPADALRYSWTVPGGTARQQAIGGAMGSLGGDLSANFVNPAGLAFYRTGDLVLSPFYRFGNNKATYLGRTEKDRESKFSLGTSGFVVGSGSSNNNSVKNVAFSLAYNRSANFNSNILYRGANPQSSFSEKFLEEINNAGLKDPNKVASEYPFGTSLAFNTYLIDTVDGGSSNNYQFQSRAANLLASGLYQENRIESRGGINEFALGLGANINDKLMLGGAFSVPVLNYERESLFTEEDTTANPNNNFEFASFREELGTRGVGINLKLGLIFKPVDYLRLGLAFHTPTAYNLTDTYTASITTNTEGYKGLLTDYSLDYTNSTPSEFKYILVTPYKAIASVSYVLREIEDVTKQRGFLTADVEYINYKASSFSLESQDTNIGDEDYFESLNRAIDNAYKGAFNFRVGGELKFTTFMVRAGAAYYGNPYKDINAEKGRRLNLSGGLGYRNKGYFIDLSYVHAMTRDVHVPYRLQDAPYASARVRSTAGNVVVTVGKKF